MKAALLWGTATLPDGITRSIRLEINGRKLRIYLWRKEIDVQWQFMAETTALAWAIGFMNQLLGVYL